MSAYKSYPKYKPSGVEWLGEIPENWMVAAVSHIFSMGRGRVISHKDILDSPGSFPVYSSQTEGGGEMGCISTFDFEGDYITWTTDGANAGTVFKREGKFNCTNVCGTLKAKNENQVETGFVAPALDIATAEYVRHDINPKLMNNVMGSIRFALPPLPEQHQIATFLDRECGKLDALQAKQERLIELLKEKRQALISHAVTRGLDPTAKLKPSDIEWLGDVPEHWVVGSLKHKWLVLDCKHMTATFVADGIPLASIGEVRGWLVDLTNAKATTEEDYLALIGGGRKPTPGDILFTRNATVGEASLVRPNLKFAMGQDVCLLRKLGEFSSDYLLHVLKSRVVTDQLAQLMIGSTFKRVNVEEIRGLVIPVPPLIEQLAIVAHLDEKCGKIDQLKAKAERGIELLKERRSALISAAVTGKIDVREA